MALFNGEEFAEARKEARRKINEDALTFGIEACSRATKANDRVDKLVRENVELRRQVGELNTWKAQHIKEVELFKSEMRKIYADVKRMKEAV